MRAAPRQLAQPVVQADLLMVAKAAAAATVAWLLAQHVLALPQPFLAPWAALLTVHATVYRSLSRGAQQVAATVLGVLLSFALAELLGITGLSLGLAMLLSLLLARMGVLREEGVTVATTALFVLTTGYGRQEQLLDERILATAVGIGVGVVLNMLVLPPLHNRSAAQHVDAVNRRLGDLLTDMAQAIRHGADNAAVGDWIDETRALDRDLDHAWEVVSSARESLRLNPRRRRLRTHQDNLSYEDVLRRLEDGVAEARSMGRTIRESTFAAQDWDPRFREAYLDLLVAVGERLVSREADVYVLRERIDGLSHELSVGDLPALFWPTYGALLVGLNNIVNVIDDVASSQPVRV